MKELDKEKHWQPFRLDGDTYDLSHLDAHTVEYVQPADKSNTEKKYNFYVTYSFHCFSKDYEHLSDEEREKLMYVTTKEKRPFCFRRYKLSKKLRSVIENLTEKHMVFHAGYECFATCTLEDDDGTAFEYYIPFKAYRYKKKLRIHVMSAYPLPVNRGKRKKVNIYAIAKNLLQGRAVPRPPQK